MKAVLIYNRSEKSYEVTSHNLPDSKADSQASALWKKGKEAYAFDQPVKHRGSPKNCDMCRQLAVDYITSQVSYSPAFIPDVAEEAPPLRPALTIGDAEVSRRIDDESDELDRKIDLGIALVRKFAPLIAALAMIALTIFLALGPFSKLLSSRLDSNTPAQTSAPSIDSQPTNVLAQAISSTETTLPQASPTRTATRIPTFTKVVTVVTPTLTPTPALPTDTPVPSCFDATAVTEEQAGETICVQGQVILSYFQEPAFYLIFSDNRVSFYMVSYDQRFDNVVPGDCVRATGEIQMLQGDPIMVLGPRDVLEPCENP